MAALLFVIALFACAAWPVLAPGSEEMAPLSELVRVEVGEASGPQHGLARFEVSLVANGAHVVETSNTITVPRALGLGAGNCSGNTNIGKSMLISLVEEGDLETTIKIELFPYENQAPIPDGLLYRCGVQIYPTTKVGVYPVKIGNLRGLDANGSGLMFDGVDGQIFVQAGEITPGDLNGDGLIDGDDLDRLPALLFRQDAGGAADVDGNGVLTASDIVGLLTKV